MNTLLVVMGLSVGTVAAGAGGFVIARRVVRWVKKYRALAAEYALYGFADDNFGGWLRIWLGEIVDGHSQPSHAQVHSTMDSGAQYTTPYESSHGASCSGGSDGGNACGG